MVKCNMLNIKGHWSNVRGQSLLDKVQWSRIKVQVWKVKGQGTKNKNSKMISQRSNVKGQRCEVLAFVFPNTIYRVVKVSLDYPGVTVLIALAIKINRARDSVISRADA